MKTKNCQNSMNDNSPFLLFNISNYKTHIDDSSEDILNKLATVLIEFMKHLTEKITIKNKHYFTYIFERGVEIIIHIFTIIFYYTKNLELTYYHTQKGYYFYCEFIEQISDDNVTFLKLSSKDAILFVYKKTIFEINNDYKKNIQECNNDDNIVLSFLSSHSHLYKRIILYSTKLINLNYDKRIDTVNKFCDIFNDICITMINNIDKMQNIECFNLLVSFIHDSNITLDLNNFHLILRLIIKKLIGIKIVNEQTIKCNLLDSEIIHLLYNNELTQFVDAIFE